MGQTSQRAVVILSTTMAAGKLNPWANGIFGSISAPAELASAVWHWLESRAKSDEACESAAEAFCQCCAMGDSALAGRLGDTYRNGAIGNSSS